MRLSKRVAALLMVACIGASGVFAAEDYEIDYNINLQKVTIKGNSQKPYSNVTVEILRSGKSAGDLQDILAADASGVIFQYDQCISDENGDFSFVFQIPQSVGSGTYLTRVGWNKQVVEKSLAYISLVDFQNALKAVNEAKREDEMISAINSGLSFLGIVDPYYEKLSGTEKKALGKYIIDNRGSGFGNDTEFKTVFLSGLALQVVNHSKNGDTDPLTVIEHYDHVLGLSQLQGDKTFKKQTGTTKKIIAGKLAEKGPFSKIEDIQAYFEELTVIYALYYASGYDAAYGILSDNNHFLKIDFTDYNRLSSKSTVDRKMVNVLFKSAADIKTDFNKYVAEASSGGGGGRNTGGSPGGGSSVSIPPVTVDKNGEDEKKETAATDFDDLDSVAWARGSILRLAEKGIVSGKGSGKFAPHDLVTREEFIKMLVSALGLHNEKAECHFADVDPTQWYYSYVASGVNAGLVSGIGENAFGTGKNILRQDIATLIYRVAQLKGMSLGEDLSQGGFSDEADISSYAIEAVGSLYAAGVISGDDMGNIQPVRSASRAEAAVMLNRFLELLN